MKKRLLAVSMAAIMAVSALTACGNNGGSGDAGNTGTGTADTGSTNIGSTDTGSTDTGSTDTGSTDTGSTDVVESGSDEGKVLNIYVWNEEFKERVEEFYPDYVKVDATHGTIGDVSVVWNVTPTEGNAYQNNLDEALLAQESAAADDKVDIFLVEADYALKYVDTDYTMNVEDLGITSAELGNQYKYTQDVMTDSTGALKGLSWQGCPAGLIYNRAIAQEVLGTDDPDEVQAFVSDWDAYLDTADQMVAAGYYMAATVNDAYRVFSNNVSSKWVVDDKIVIDDALLEWVAQSKAMVDGGATTTYGLWGDEWSQGFYPNGINGKQVFCYFGPAWFFDFSMHGDDPESIAADGGWAITKGPQGFFWGGTWIAAATGTDNPTLVADIMRTLTVDDATMEAIAQSKGDFVNNTAVVDKLAADDSFGDAYLGGQNYLSVLAAGASSIDLSNLSAYDQACNEEFQAAMKNYFEGNATLEEALDLFYKAVEEKHPELSH